jgi:hypothetical protein
MGAFTALPLGEHLNNRGLTSGDRLDAGLFNVWRNSFPAEHVPMGRELRVDGTPFQMPALVAGAPDNLRCEGQLLRVPEGRYDWIHVVAASERRTEDALFLHFTDGSVDREWLRISDFWDAPAHFGETEVVATPVMHYPHHVQPRVSAKLWMQRVPVTRRQALRAIRLPRNVAIHVFALTLGAAACHPTKSAPPGTPGEARRVEPRDFAGTPA